MSKSIHGYAVLFSSAARGGRGLLSTVEESLESLRDCYNLMRTTQDTMDKMMGTNELILLILERRLKLNAEKLLDYND